MNTILVKQHNDEYYIYFFINNQKQLFNIYKNKDIALKKANELCKLHNFTLLTSLDTTQQQLETYYKLFVQFEKQQNKEMTEILKNKILELLPEAQAQSNCGLIYEGIND